MQVLINGQPREVPDRTTIAELLEQLELSTKPVAVEVNLELVPRAQHEQQWLQDGDQLEVVTLVGGG